MQWDTIRLVVFDLDGTLYEQRCLRLKMLLRLAADAASSRSLEVIRVLKEFRRCREELGETQAPGFETRQYQTVAERTGHLPEYVRSLVEEWIERRPLEILHKCRSSGVERLFCGLSAKGKTIAVLSDYPARDKLRALHLAADVIVYAGDPDVGFLKPHPAGLRHILNEAKVPPSAAIMIGDRVDRDWEVARRSGVRALIKSRRPLADIDTFRDFEDDVFSVVAATKN
ncbi:HAD family hydrolase [Ensifer sp. 4252]|uniref:HAD family hydrolase n=1 Tax=Ensifer sp. 4252 TaxID=3373915 RepID=UPI003D1BA224